LELSDSGGPQGATSHLSGKSPLLAVLLQCLPLLFVGGCLASTFGPASWYLDSPGDWIIEILVLAGLAWGLGYAYLKQPERLARAIGSGVILLILSWWLNIVLLDGCIDLGTSEQCPERVRIFDRPFSLITAAFILFWVLLYARDAFKMATALAHGRSADEAGGKYYLNRIAIASSLLGICVFAFYFSNYCTQLWNNTK
jgi:hypothetical protein